MGKLKYTATLLVILVWVLMLQFSYHSKNQKLADWVASASSNLEIAAEKLQSKGERLKINLQKADIPKEEIIVARLGYKKLEFLLEYFYPGYIEEHINGAPLLHIKRQNTSPFVVPPEGLQVLDELIFSDDAEDEGLLISQLTQDFNNHIRVVLSALKQERINRADVVEAMREELIRVFSMGLTGFDTPGSVNALAEACQSLMAQREVLQLICTNKECNHLSEQLTLAVQFLETNNDFDSFDRLNFLMEYINPIYEGLGHIREQWPEEATSVKSARNLKASGIFDTEFLDPYFFTELKETEDSEALRKLGEKLFYDPILSGSGKMSCASCHIPEKGFADAKPKSMSNVTGHTVERNSPTLLNAVFADRYFYDLRAFTLEQQVEHVIFNESEFNTAYAEIIDKLQSDKSYKKAFKKSFGSAAIDRKSFSAALASYVLSLQSLNSSFDKYARGETDSLPASAKAGFNLFMGKAGCGTCHFAPTFSGLVPPRYTKNESEILGVLDKPKGWGRTIDADMGRVENGIYSELAWIYERSFKTSTVRNVKLTAPYFHNGAYGNLQQVVEFYNNGGGQGIGLEVKNQTLPGDSLHLTQGEMNDIISFMKSLTDTTSLTNYDH